MFALHLSTLPSILHIEFVCMSACLLVYLLGCLLPPKCYACNYSFSSIFLLFLSLRLSCCTRIYSSIVHTYLSIGYDYFTHTVLCFFYFLYRFLSQMKIYYIRVNAFISIFVPSTLKRCISKHIHVPRLRCANVCVMYTHRHMLL